MRTPQATDYNSILNDVEALRAESRAAEDRHKQLDGLLQRELAQPTDNFHAGTVREIRIELSDLASRRALLEDRIAARLAQLPSDDARSAAMSRGRQLAANATAAAEDFATAWRTFLTALRTAERASREVMDTRERAAQARLQLQDLVIRFGLNLTLPPAPTPAPLEAKLAGHIALYLQSIGYDCKVDGTAELYLRDLEKQLEDRVGATA